MIKHVLTLFWILSWLLFAGPLGAQQTVEENMAALEAELQHANTSDSLTILLHYTIEYAGERPYHELMLPYLHELNQLAIAQNHTKTQQRVANTLSFIHGTKLEIDSMQHYTQLSMQLAERIQVDSFWASSYHIMSNTYVVLQQYDSAMYYATQAAAMYERETVDMPFSLANAYKEMGTIIARSQRRGNEQSLAYARKALEACPSGKDPMIKSRFIINLAVEFGFLEQNDSAYHYIQLALERGKRFKHANVEASALHLLSEYYYFTDRYKEALLWVDSVQTHHAQHLSINQNHNSLLTKTEALYQLGRYEESLAEAKKLMASAEKHDIGFLLRDLSKHLSMVYSQMGNYEEALHMLQNYSAYNAKLFHEKQASVVNLLEKKYELAKKDRDLAKAHEQQAQQELTFQRRWSLISVFILLALLLGAYLFGRSRMRTLKAEKEASELEQRLLRSQMNPHFAFNTLGSIQNYLLQSGESNKAAYYLAKFSKLMRQILEQSRASVIPLEEELATLKNYLSLQQLRYENKFTFELEIDEKLAADTTLIPPMLIQPLIENAIEHGKIHTLEHGKVSISIQPTDQLLTVCVKDNGLGKKTLHTPPLLSKPKSVASSIIKERLLILRKRYGAGIDFQVRYPETGGTEVFLHLPYIPQAL